MEKWPKAAKLEEEVIEPEDDDSFMDWETRNESIPMTKHIIAGR